MAKLPDVFKANVPIAHRLDMRLTFGKYRDLTVEKIIEIEPAYLLWAHRNVQFFRLADDVYLDVMRAHKKEQKQRRQMQLRSSRTHAGGIDLEMVIRNQMSGQFGVHMTDLDLFIEGDWRDANNMSDEDDMDHWSHMRPY